MKAKSKDDLIRVCEQVSNDMEKDSKELDGKPFDGKTVATYFGYQAAAIRALSEVIKRMLNVDDFEQTEVLK